MNKVYGRSLNYKKKMAVDRQTAASSLFMCI